MYKASKRNLKSKFKTTAGESRFSYNLTLYRKMNSMGNKDVLGTEDGSSQ